MENRQVPPRVNLISPAIISESHILWAVKKIKSSLSAGHDSIPNHIIKGCINPLLPVLTHIFNYSLLKGSYPKSWKKALVIPIPKKGNSHVISNYRPISLLCGFAKLFDKIIQKHLYFNLVNKISSYQHGFISSRSTNTNLFNYVNDLFNEVSYRGQIDTIFIDLQKAFDSVNHDILLNKLKLLGLNNKYLLWIKDYLTKRCFQVKIENKLSSVKNLNVGVPQGGNLSPLLFNCFIDDICQTWSDCAGCKGLLFADDLKIYMSIKTLDDCSSLQQVLNKINTWCLANRININFTKSVYMQSTRKRSLIEYIYTLNNLPLKKVATVKDLGIFIDEKLHFHEHIDYLIKYCKKIWFQILYITKYSSEYKQLITLYITLIRSRLEYAAIVWNNLTNSDCIRIEYIQAKLYLKLNEKFGPRCLVEVKLNFLELRRKFLQAMFVFKTLLAKIDNVELLNNLGLSTTLNSCRNKGLLTLINYNNVLHTVAINNYNIFRRYFLTFDSNNINNNNIRTIWKNLESRTIP